MSLDLEPEFEVFLRLYEDNVNQSRHHEVERAAVIGVVVAIGAALVGLVTFDGAIAGVGDAVVALFLLATGIFGAAFSYKNYERSSYHFERARALRNVLDETHFGGRIRAAQKGADERHRGKFGRIQRLALHRWWIAMNLSIALLALLLIGVALFRPIGG